MEKMEPLLSSRMRTLKASPTLALNAKAKQLIAQGIDVVNMAVGEPDFATPRSIVEKAIEALGQGRTKYSTAGGSIELRQAICRKLKRDNQLEYKPNEIAVGIGAKEILFHLFMAIVDEDDEVLIPAPYWVSYSSQVELAGGICTVIPPKDILSGNALQIDRIAASISDHTKVIILNSPNNPAGLVHSKDELMQLAAILRLHPHIWVISDEIYEYMNYIGSHISLLNIASDIKDRFILINGLSKAFAMTGWRVGYAACQEKLATVLRDLQSQSSTCLPPFIEDAAICALDQGATLVANEIADLKSRRDYAIELIHHHKIPVGIVKAQGAFYLFIDCNDWIKNISFSKGKPKSNHEFCSRLLTDYHIALVPGDEFGMPGFLRMSYACSRENIKKAVERLALASQQMLNQET